MFPPKNERTNSTLLLWNLRSTCFRSFFWRKLKTPKRHFEIIWPLMSKVHFPLISHMIPFKCRLKYISFLETWMSWELVWNSRHCTLFFQEQIALAYYELSTYIVREDATQKNVRDQNLWNQVSKTLLLFQTVSRWVWVGSNWADTTYHWFFYIFVTNLHTKTLETKY